MKIVHVISGLNIGGAELMLERMVTSERWAHNGDEHLVISLTSLGPVGERLRAAGVPVEAIRLGGFIGSLRGLLRLRSLIAEAAPSIVQTWMYHANLMGGLAAKMAGQHGVVWNLRTAATSDARYSWSTRAVRKLCAWISHWLPVRIIAASTEVQESHLALGYASERMVVVGNGFRLPADERLQKARPAVRAGWGLDKDDLLIGMVARFDPLKGHRIFVEAAANLVHTVPKARFAIVGRDCTNENTELCRWIDALGLRERFLLCGQRSDVSECLAAFDIACLPSLVEGFPNALGEAMAAGKACVATDVGGAIDLLADSGIIVPKGDPDALAAGLRKLAELGPEGRAAIGQTARQRIANEFGLDKCLERYEDLYAESILLTNSRG